MNNQTLFKQLIDIECPDSTYRPTNYPIVLSRAKGSLIYDIEGKEYIDLCAGFGALPLGHNHPSILNLMKHQIQDDIPTICHALGDVYPSQAKIELLTMMRSMLPPHLNKIALAVTGGQAIELALKTAMLATKAHGFIAFKEGYHGLDLGALPVTSRSDFKQPFQSWLHQQFVTHVSYGSQKKQVISAIDQQCAQGIKTAAIIVEPLQGRGGVIVPPAGWLQMLKDVCVEKGILLIFDEIFTGFGRIGKISSADEVKSDISCFGKALGGGLPLSACVATKNVMDAWPECHAEALHTGTFFGHAWTCQVAIATLYEFENQNLCHRSVVVGDKFRKDVQELFHSKKSIKDIRGQGLMTAIEFHQSGDGAVLMDRLREHGVVAIPSGDKGQCLSITPALNIEDQALQKALKIIDRLIN